MENRPTSAEIANMIENFKANTGTAFRDDQIRDHLHFCNYILEDSIERFV